MIEKCKEYLKKNFSNGPKAKIMLSVIVVAIIATVIVTSLRKTVTIVLDGNEVKVVTFKGTVKDLLQDEGIEVKKRDDIMQALFEYSLIGNYQQNNVRFKYREGGAENIEMDKKGYFILHYLLQAYFRHN